MKEAEAQSWSQRLSHQNIQYEPRRQVSRRASQDKDNSHFSFFGISEHRKNEEFGAEPHLKPCPTQQLMQLQQSKHLESSIEWTETWMSI